MALLESGGKTFTIPAGDAVLGSEADSVVPLTGAGVLPRHAMLQGQRDGQVVIRKAVPEADVTINGVRLGAEPTPLLHGDKVQVGGHELTFVDERRKGGTQHMQAMAPDAAAGGKGGPAEATGPAGHVPAAVSTGGRVVCLTDGREYQVGDTALVFGRDAVNDVVVPGQDVSRRHAEILPTPAGYVVVDASTNGTFVNEQRVEGRRTLARADIIRIGDEQFRFYADTVATAPPPPAAAESPGAMERLKDTIHGIPAAVAPPAQGAKPLANFRIKAGTNKGLRLAVRTPVVNIGRADYNDIVLQDPSVSTAHAKLQQREGIWILTDLESTNGTEVDGERVRGEAALPPGATVRIGDVVLSFEPGDDAVSVAKGGGTQVMRAGDLPAGPPAVAAPPSPPPPAARPPRPRRPVAKAPPPKKGKGCGSSAALFVVAIAAVAYWMLG